MKTARDKFDELLENCAKYGYSHNATSKHCADLALEIAEQEREKAFKAGRETDFDEDTEREEFIYTDYEDFNTGNPLI